MGNNNRLSEMGKPDRKKTSYLESLFLMVMYVRRTSGLQRWDYCHADHSSPGRISQPPLVQIRSALQSPHPVSCTYSEAQLFYPLTLANLLLALNKRVAPRDYCSGILNVWNLFCYKYSFKITKTKNQKGRLLKNAHVTETSLHFLNNQYRGMKFIFKESSLLFT